jgi:uncharacterized membrane protein
MTRRRVNQLMPEVTPTAQDNVEFIASLDDEDNARVGPLRGLIERVSSVFGTPGYFVFVLGFVACWIAVNLWGQHAGWRHVDAPPFFWLQGLVSSNALLLTISVLIRQDRQARLAAHRAHLDLQINMLTERKVAKALELIALLDEHQTENASRDEHVAELSKPADAQALMGAIKDTAGPKTSA